MQRVMIVGQPGSGKSTLARELGAVTGLPVFHMDHIHWKSGWVMRADDERLAMHEEVVAQEAWIFEGGFSNGHPTRAARADTLVWLDVGVWTRLWRVTSRYVRYFGRERPDLPEGCPESLGWHNLEFYAFIWRTRNSSRQKLVRLTETAPDRVDLYILRTLEDVDAFLTAQSKKAAYA